MEQLRGQPRLLKLAVPRQYGVKLKQDLNFFHFFGSVAVDLDAVADARFLVLNAPSRFVRAYSITFTCRDSLIKVKPIPNSLFVFESLFLPIFLLCGFNETKKFSM